MNKINLKKFSTKEITEKISNQLSIDLKKVCNSNSLAIPSAHGQGFIYTIDFENGINVLILEVNLTETFTLNFQSGHYYPLNIMHAHSGSIIHEFCDGNLRYELSPMQNSFTACPCDSSQSLTIPGGKNVSVTMISIQRDVYTELNACHKEEDLPEVFLKTIADAKSEGTFFFQGRSDIQLSKALQKLQNSVSVENVEDFVFAGSDMYNALGHFIRNYKENQDPERYKVVLNEYDTECLTKARDVILSNLKNPPTIPELAKLVGINQQKLKKGFKVLFGTTINRFLIKKRMETAKILLAHKNSSVKDVALEVGYNSPSHFSTKFKEQFGLLPKDYLKSVKVM